jgi:hypothetical protein
MADTFSDVSSIGSTDTGVDSSVDSSNDSYDTQTDDGSGVDDGSGEGSGEHTEGEHSQPTERTDGRKGPASVRTAIKALSESAPDHAAALKALGASHFREQAFRKEFPGGVQEAQSVKSLVAAAGGLEGITTLQQQHAHYTAQDELLRAGDPAALDNVMKEFPEGMANLAAPFLERLATANPDALQSAIAPYAVSMLQNAGLPEVLKQIYNASTPEQAKKLAADAFNWFAQQSQAAGQLKQQPGAKNPANDRIKQQQTELDQQREQIFKDGTNSKFYSSLRPQFEKVVDQLASKNKWSETQKLEFRNRLISDIDSKMGKNTTYAQQLKLHMANKQRTHDTVSTYMTGEYVRLLNSKDGAMATEQAFNRLIGKQTGSTKPGSGVVKATAPKTAPDGSAVRVSQRPSDDQIDHTKTDTLSLMKSEAWLKNGRRVSWRTWV